MNTLKTSLLLGIGGVGMRSLAALMHQQGIRIIGYDRDLSNPVIQRLKDLNIDIYDETIPMDQLKDIQEVITSTAVEDQNPVYRAIQALKMPILHRSQKLLELIMPYKKVLAVCGTSGKSTVTALLAHVLDACGYDADCYVGADRLDVHYCLQFGARFSGSYQYMVLETDESDKSLLNFHPQIAFLTNIGQDHYPEQELLDTFQKFANQVQEEFWVCVDALSDRIQHSNRITVSMQGKADFIIHDVKLFADQSIFKINGMAFEISQPGLHSVWNAGLVASYAMYHQIKPAAINAALKTFTGLSRRFTVIPVSNHRRIIDDYAHNPNKIGSAIQTCHLNDAPLLVIFQPHGYGPLKLQWAELIKIFLQTLKPHDRLLLLPVYDKGGTADRTINSQIFLDAIQQQAGNFEVKLLSSLDEVLQNFSTVTLNIKQILVLGARNSMMGQFCQQLSQAWEKC